MRAERTPVDQSKILIRSTKSRLNRSFLREMRCNPRVRTIKIQKDGKLQVHFIGKGERCAGGGRGEMGYNQRERRGALGGGGLEGGGSSGRTGEG